MTHTKSGKVVSCMPYSDMICPVFAPCQVMLLQVPYMPYFRPLSYGTGIIPYHTIPVVSYHWYDDGSGDWTSWKCRILAPPKFLPSLDYEWSRAKNEKNRSTSIHTSRQHKTSEKIGGWGWGDEKHQAKNIKKNIQTFLDPKLSLLVLNLTFEERRCSKSQLERLVITKEVKKCCGNISRLADLTIRKLISTLS